MDNLRITGKYPYQVYEACKIPTGRIRDLPKKDQAAFSKRLNGQTCPWVEHISEKDQDFFYVSDWEDWNSGFPVYD